MEVAGKSRREQIREALLEQIGSGEIGPGERIIEARLAEEFGVSTIPVREAIRELVAMGMLEFERHRGAWVRKVSLLETIEALDVRAALELLAARSAVSRLRENCAALHRSAAAIVAAARRRDFVAFQQHNQVFHRAIFESAGNATLLRIWDSLGFEVRTRVILEHLSRINLVSLAEEHETIAEAFEQGDGKRAAALLQSHSRSLIRYLKQKAKFEGNRGANRSLSASPS